MSCFRSVVSRTTICVLSNPNCQGVYIMVASSQVGCGCAWRRNLQGRNTIFHSSSASVINLPTALSRFRRFSCPVSTFAPSAHLFMRWLKFVLREFEFTYSCKIDSNSRNTSNYGWWDMKVLVADTPIGRPYPLFSSFQRLFWSSQEIVVRQGIFVSKF